MKNIISIWNKNRKTIITAIIAIALLIILIQILNQFAKNSKKSNTIKEDTEGLPTKSIIGGETVSVEITKNNVEEIETFIKKCNSGDIEGAFNMLTDDCKDVLFANKLENFKKGYTDIIFSSKRIANIENFISNDGFYTYRVKFYADMLSTGNTQNKEFHQDYITICKNEPNGKLNINSLIYKENINRESEINGIKVIVTSKQVYKDYEKYEIKFENNTDKRILIDTKKQNKTTYLVGSNGVLYNSNISEISSTLCEIPANFYRVYNIKFDKIYSLGVQTEGITFSDVVPDYETYKQNTKEYIQRLKISVSM